MTILQNTFYVFLYLGGIALLVFLIFSVVYIIVIGTMHMKEAIERYRHLL